MSAVVASLVFVTFMTVSTSRAAFSASTSNTTNNAVAGTVALSDDDTGTAMFNLTDMTPGNTFTKCITVTYTGTIPTQPVKIYRSGTVTGTGLDEYLDLDIEIGTGGTYANNCAGFTSSGNVYNGTLKAFATTHTAYSDGATTTWTPSANPQTRTFRFTLEVQDTNTAQGKTAGFGFTWEAQS